MHNSERRSSPSLAVSFAAFLLLTPSTGLWAQEDSTQEQLREIRSDISSKEDEIKRYKDDLGLWCGEIDNYVDEVVENRPILERYRGVDLNTLDTSGLFEYAEARHDLEYALSHLDEGNPYLNCTVTVDELEKKLDICTEKLRDLRRELGELKGSRGQEIAGGGGEERGKGKRTETTISTPTWPRQKPSRRRPRRTWPRSWR